MNPVPQSVTDYPNHNAVFMTWNFKPAANNVKQVFQQVCKLVINLNHTAAIRFPDARVSCIMGIGYEAWMGLGMPQPLPKELVTFKEIIGSKYVAVATGGDLQFHLRADNISICYDMTIDISNTLRNVADCTEELHGFRYWDGRSILGFVDGTENPEGIDRNFFAKVGEEDAFYKEGSYLFIQKYIHNLNAWNNLSVEDQEKAFGRTKVQDIEMPDDTKPSNSHSALANVGDDLKVVRDNMPFGKVTENEIGTYFIAYASTFSTLQKMLENMFIGNPPGNYDRILDFSTAKTGALFFVPTLNMLNDYTPL